MNTAKRLVTFAGIVLALHSPAGIAQQVTGELGSPGATITIDGKQLPPPAAKFGGVIKEKASESKAWWAPRVAPPKGAPNVLLKPVFLYNLRQDTPSTCGICGTG